MDASDMKRTIGHIDNSLQAAEELLSTLLDISKLDAGALTPRRTHFALADIIRPLRAEFEVMAEDRGLDLVVVPTGAWRSEERRVGKECRCRGAPDDEKENIEER